MTTQFADLHCHPVLYSYNRMRHTDAERDLSRYHPWHILPSNTAHMRDGKRGATYTQATPDMLTRGRCRLVFASFTPIERGFFFQPGPNHPPTRLGAELLKLATGVTAARALGALARRDLKGAAFTLTGALRNRGVARQLVQQLVMRYSAARIKHMMSPEYDYWDELWREYRFLASADGQTHTVSSPSPEGPIQVTGCYHIARSAEQAREIVEDEQRDDLCMILTIEGGHVFSVGPDERPLSCDAMLARIDALKQCEYPFFFITLAHHFDNGVCGHAHSIPDLTTLVINQDARLHQGFEPREGLGLRVARALLGLDEQLRPDGTRRILIDAKHLSPLARQQYYQQLVVPHNDARAQWPKPLRARYPELPIIFSHAAYSGVATLEQLMRDADREDDSWLRGEFYAWGLNMCDEDVRMVHRTGGMIGLVFERRVAGMRANASKHPALVRELVIKQLLGVVDVIMSDDRLSDEDKARAWDIVCLGTDYDGFIDPVSIYPTAAELPQFADDLRDALQQRRHTRQIEAIGVEVLVEKIAWRNAHDFAQRHFPASCDA